MGKEDYKFLPLRDVVTCINQKVNLVGVVVEFGFPRRSKGTGKRPSLDIVACESFPLNYKLLLFFFQGYNISNSAAKLFKVCNFSWFLLCSLSWEVNCELDRFWLAMTKQRPDLRLPFMSLVVDWWLIALRCIVLSQKHYYDLLIILTASTSLALLGDGLVMTICYLLPFPSLWLLLI